MYKQILINGQQVNVVKVKAIHNNGAWLSVYVDNAENTGHPVACHSLPKLWFDNQESTTIVTSGNEYKNLK